MELPREEPIGGDVLDPNADGCLGHRDRIAGPVRARLGARPGFESLLEPEVRLRRRRARRACRERGRANDDGEKSLHTSAECTFTLANFCEIRLRVDLGKVSAATALA